MPKHSQNYLGASTLCLWRGLTIFALSACPRSRDRSPVLLQELQAASIPDSDHSREYGANGELAEASLLRAQHALSELEETPG